MKRSAPVPYNIETISGLHKQLGLPGPLHPLVSLIDNTKIAVDVHLLPETFILGFYKISFKKLLKGRIGYGQGYYDYDEGGLVFTAPHQVIAIDKDAEFFGATLLIHPDFLRNHPLGKTIGKYGFFSYEANEALHLSEKERTTILEVLQHIERELNNPIDDFSQDVLLSYLEVLLNYSNRFYKRQFITRKAVNHDLLSKMEQLLNEYFETAHALNKGLPTVEYLAEQLHLSPRYLSDMLRSLTGQNAQQHIHEKLIEKAKEKLSTTNLSVSEIAYELGFEHPQSFSKLFKIKTKLSPLEFRQSFN
ncbi:helix-turn-helix transcriptional regulator [Paraflavitalea sp. CAU 1676]|uniref:helix-turn-helix domain-containing protein n=1 Tax=Paraflavitalea sp. CAU 1676 TaxID=3032598 RepID=UPI0023DB3EC8|nr:helix-turn-helix transcriptional regulator [Paraflavitalea sp. CAU 1676]MDF2189021.1 helix-turn-helix transcriptional regulator [Paraflavitalea sp. CAU 1676]